MRLSRILRSPDSSSESEALSLGQLVLWGVFGLVVITGLVLYFKYARLIVSLLT